MHMLGLELFDNGALAISADENGRIMARGQSQSKDDPVAAALLPSRRSGPIPRRPPWRQSIRTRGPVSPLMQALSEALSRIVW